MLREGREGVIPTKPPIASMGGFVGYSVVDREQRTYRLVGVGLIPHLDQLIGQKGYVKLRGAVCPEASLPGLRRPDDRDLRMFFGV